MSFVFPEKATRRFEWPVTVRVPGTDERGKRVAKQTFTAHFEELPQDDIERIAADERADLKLLEKVLVGWHGVTEGDGKEVAFTATRRDRLLQVPYARLAIAEAYYEALLGGGRARGNS